MKKIKKILLFLAVGISLAACGKSEPVTETQQYYEDAEERAEKSVEDSGSRTEEIYNNAMDRFLNEEVVRPEGDNFADRLLNIFLRAYLRFYHVMSSVAPLICICSIIIGGLMMFFAKKNKRIRRMGLFTFIIGVPLLMIFGVFGLGILNGIFLY